jgi:hypothetical protein
VLFGILITIICCAGLVQAAPPQEEAGKGKQSQQVDTREYVEVVNIQMVLRALKKGRTIGGLRQEDVTLYENGKAMPLTSFREVRRKVAPPAADETVKTRVETKKRLFFLYFRLSEPDPNIQAALDYFFNNVYRDGDYALLMFRNRVFPIPSRSRVEPVLASFNRTLAEAVKVTRREKQKMSENMERGVRAYLDEISKSGGSQAIQEASLFRMLSNFKLAWQQYRHHYVTREEERLKGIAASLKKVDIEKWGIVFYQQDQFPRLNMKSVFRMRSSAPAGVAKLRKEIEIIARDMSQATQSVKTIKNFQRAFIEANATFHLLLSNPTSLGKLTSTYLKYSAAHTDWQQAFRLISEETGGGIILDNQWQDSLVKAVEREDIFYRITYKPAKSGKQRRNIRIRTKLPGIKLKYHRKVKVTPPGQDKIAIGGFSFKHPVLQFTLKHYRQFFDGARLRGDIEVKISGVDEKGKMINFKRLLEPDMNETTVSMSLNFPSGGQYSLIVEAFDLQTGKTAIFSKKVEIPKSKYQLEPVLVMDELEEMTGTEAERTLNALLNKTALYCRKLEKATFYFICTEEVIDNHWYRGNRIKEKHYLYDYQITKEDKGKMSESRKLKAPGSEPSADTKPAAQKKILTNFVSSYPYLMPISMLSKKNRSKYRFRLLGSETIAGRAFYRVSVEPKQEGVMLDDANYGIVWIDEKDGSIYKIQVDPNSLGGIKGLKTLARQKRNRLKMTDVHLYEVLRKGLRFPSKTEISCSFLDWDSVKRVQNRFNVSALEEVGTVFEYKEYKFFNVSIDVVDSGHQ